MPLVAVWGADHHKQLDGDVSIAPMELSPHITAPLRIYCSAICRLASNLKRFGLANNAGSVKTNFNGTLKTKLKLLKSIW